MWNIIYRTEFFYQPSDHSLSIEEISDNFFDWEFINRYAHMEFDLDENKVTHFDWSINIYDENTKEQRKWFTLDKKIKNSKKHIKLFRIDWKIELNDWQEILLNWFSYNELVYEWIDPISYKSDYKDILVKNLDF